MVDITSTYIATCNAVHPSSPSLSTSSPPNPHPHPNLKQIAANFRSDVDTICFEITKVSDVIADNYEAYTNFGIYPDVANLSDRERDDLDDHVAQRLNRLKSKLDALHLAAYKDGLSLPPIEGSYGLFKQAVVTAVVESFQQVNKLSGQMQMIRMKRTLAGRPALCAVANEVMKENKFDVDVEVEMEVEIGKGKGKGVEGDGDLMEEMRDEFELENAELQSKLNEDLLGAKKAEQQLAEFSQLLSVFNEKVVEQSEIIDNIYDNTSTSVNTVEKGTEELRKTDERMKNDFQVFFAFIIASIVLLFYDS